MPKLRVARERSAFGTRMEQSRKRAGLTQMRVCEALSLSQGTLSELEGTASSSGRVTDFADLYGVDARWLATGIGPEPSGHVARPHTDELTVSVEPARLLELLGRWLAVVPTAKRRAVAENLAGFADEGGAEHRRAALLALLTSPPSDRRQRIDDESPAVTPSTSPSTVDNDSTPRPGSIPAGETNFETSVLESRRKKGRPDGSDKHR